MAAQDVPATTATRTEHAPRRRSRVAEPLRLGLGLTLAVSAVIGVALGLQSGLGLLWFVPYVLVGSLLLVRSKGGVIGPLLLAIGWAHVLLATPVPASPNDVADGTASLAVLALAILSGGPAGPGLFLLYFVLMTVFPDGHLPTGRWGTFVRVAVGVTGALVVGTTFATTITLNWSGSSVGVPIPNPIAIAPESPLSQTLASGLVSMPAAVLMVVGAVSLVLRYRGTDGLEQQQLRWIVAALTWIVAAVVGGFVVGTALPEIGSTGVQWLPAAVSFPLVPIAIGIAVLRYRLYEIDIVIRRTLVYVPLTAILAGSYAATTGFLQRFFVTITGNRSDGAVIMSTLVLVALFTPVKNALQGWVDRHFRDPHDLERHLAIFIDEVRGFLGRPDPDRVLARFLTVAVQGIAATGGAAQVPGGDGAWTTVARIGETTPVLTVDVAGSAGAAGRIELGARRGGGPFPEADVASMQSAAARLADAMARPA